MVPWMSGLVSGLQNRVRRFESARNLKKSSETTDNKQFRSFLIFRGANRGEISKKARKIITSILQNFQFRALPILHHYLIEG